MFWSRSPTSVTMEPCFPVDPTGGIPLTSVFETYQSNIKFVTTFSSLGMNNDPSNVKVDSIDTERQTFTQIRVQGTTVSWLAILKNRFLRSYTIVAFLCIK